MNRLFEDRTTPAGTQAIQNLIDYLAEDLNRSIEVHGEKSPDALQCLLRLISIEQTIERSEKTHDRIRGYFTMSEEIYGPRSREAANGLFLLGRSHVGLGRFEEGALIIEQSLSRAEDQPSWPPIEPMMEALCQLLENLQKEPNSEKVRHAFVLGLRTLSWLVTFFPTPAPVFALLLERIRPVFESWGFTKDVWGWFVRRCHWRNNSFIGLISVLLEEGMFPSEAQKANVARDGESDESHLLEGFEIVGVTEEHWESSEGFSKAFPVSAAKGEFSLRVERLLAEGCRCLSTTGGVPQVFLVFSPHFIGTRITAFGTGTWSNADKVLCAKTLRRVIAENGADSAMFLAWADIRVPESDDPAQEGVIVVGRDEKSFLAGIQFARKNDGKYVFDEPMVKVADDNFLSEFTSQFSEFTFPVKPGAKTLRRKPAKKKAKMRAKKMVKKGKRK